jgi:hypothetical protein
MVEPAAVAAAVPVVEAVELLLQVIRLETVEMVARDTLSSFLGSQR